jgi:2-oxoglutarate dehydrogenase complex dihydrolipoamide succinyltransferase (E2) component
MVIVEVKAPQFSESVSEGILLRWHKTVGQTIARDETLSEIETDKIVLEIPSPACGALTEVLKNHGDTVVAGEVIAKIATEDAAMGLASAAPQTNHSAASHVAQGVVMPAAAKMLVENGLAADHVVGTGKDGRITKGDVIDALQKRNVSAQPAIMVEIDANRVPPTDSSIYAGNDARHEERVPMSRLRARIAERLLQSQASTATLSTFNEVNMQPIIDLRNQYKDRFKREHGINLGFMSFFVKAAAEALKKYPILNASVDGNDIVYHRYFDIGIAVASPRGLVVPILRNADRLSLAEIEQQIHQFDVKAREGKLTLDDLTGGTFSISNSGIFGAMLSVPIINPPQSAILGIHATKNRPIADQGQTVIRPMTNLALSYDHRIIDGREAVLGLGAIKEALEDPRRWLPPEAQPIARSAIAKSKPREAHTPVGSEPNEMRPLANGSVLAAESGVAWSATILTEKTTQAELRASLAALLSIEPCAIGLDDQFTDLGLDSVSGVDWIDDINRRCGTSLMATLVYAYPSIRQLAAFLSTQQMQLDARQAAGIMVANHERTQTAQSSDQIPAVHSERQAACPTRPAQQLVAIIGMSGRYAGASTLDQYWENISSGKNCVVEIPKSRWNVDAYYDPRPFQAGKTSSKWLGMIDGVEFFDPLFFGISPADAEVMDPQQRIFLQEAYRAFENAGYAPHGLSEKKCGVYLGLCSNDYGLLLRQGGTGVADRLGNSCAVASARIAYYLNLKGPAITIDTACSSSLVAMHLASQALLNGETDLALAGGVSLYLAPELYLCWSAAGMLSLDGQCKTFDRGANGFVPGEGGGAVVLKRLSDAERDGDNILGVLLGSGINQDGKTNGITAPSMTRQTELVRDIYTKHGIDAASISYVEAHGTGTKLGDPIELEALSAAFRRDTGDTNFCAIGSVKSNIGHTTAAAGVAGVHKVLLSLKHRQLAPTVNFTAPNEHFNFAASPFFANTELRRWGSQPGVPRRAAVSSFGVSGTNAHLVIEEYLPPAHRRTPPITVDAEHPILFVLSARTADRLQAYAALTADYLTSHADISLADAAYTLQVGRDPMDHRLAFVATSRDSLLKALTDFVQGKVCPGMSVGHVQKKHETGLFEHDTDIDALLRAWMAKRKLHKIGELWAAGLDIDWQQLYGPATPQRIGIPTYPFAPERYWLPDGGRQDDAAVRTRIDGPGGVAVERAEAHHRLASPPFDADFYAKVIDDVMKDEMHVDTAAVHAKNAMFSRKNRGAL